MNDWLQLLDQLKSFIIIDENDFLREKCTNIELMNAAIAQGESLLTDAIDEDRMTIVKNLGNLYRIKGEPEKLIPYLEEFEKLCKEKSDESSYTIALILHADALKYAKRYDESIAMFEEAMERCQMLGQNEIENYVWQHLGKCYLEMGNLKQAETCFLKALMLRKQMNNPDLLEASETVLKFMMKIKK